MSDADILSEAARALRSTRSESVATPNATRHRMLASLDRRRRTRQNLSTVLVTLVAISTASTAWAAVTGRLPLARMPRFFGSEAVTAPLPQASAPSRPRPARVSNATPVATLEAATAPGAPDSITHLPPRSVSAETAAPVAHGSASVEPAVAVLARSAPRQRSSDIETSHGRAPVHGAVRSASADLEDLYREAHTAHFVSRDPAGALAAWDRYLRAAPSGRFAPEARYNRALTLVRLQRGADAIEALRPFAEGADGSYRQREAAALLSALASQR